MIATLMHLQVICSILTEQRVVFFSSDWARLTLMAECFILFIHPLRWQHPYVPVLSRQMMDFLMAPTAYLMGCHVEYLEDVAAVRAIFIWLVHQLSHCPCHLYPKNLCIVTTCSIYCTLFMHEYMKQGYLKMMSQPFSC